MVANMRIPDDPMHIPFEFCTVLEGQAVRRLLSEDQIGRMVTFACRAPNVNVRLLTEMGTSMFGMPPNHAAHMLVSSLVGLE